jgi:hypothetical protein
MAIEPKILTFGTNKVGTIGGKLMGYTEPPIPLQITDSRLWLNNDLATMTVNGSNRVSQWRDSSGNLNHFSQGTGANQPLFVSNGINGQNGVKWSNSSNEWLDCTFGSVINQKYTIITVWNLDASSTQTYPYVYDRNGAIGDRIQLYWFGNNIRIGSPTVVTAYAKTRPFNLMSSEVCYDNTSSKVYQNGVLQATVSSGSSSLTSLRLGHLNSTDTLSRLSGYICEMIVYAKELSAGERTLINDYLTLKYGL